MAKKATYEENADLCNKQIELWTKLVVRTDAVNRTSSGSGVSNSNTLENKSKVDTSVQYVPLARSLTHAHLPLARSLP